MPIPPQDDAQYNRTDRKANRVTRALEIDRQIGLKESQIHLYIIPFFMFLLVVLWVLKNRPLYCYKRRVNV